MLEPLFDLEPEERAGVTYIAPATPGMVANPTRIRWKDEHVKYFYELMELAMLQLNRQLYVSDFKAITEALHRLFRVNGGIVERGYNTVHSFATRKPAYNRGGACSRGNCIIINVQLLHVLYQLLVPTITYFIHRLCSWFLAFVIYFRQLDIC